MLKWIDQSPALAKLLENVSTILTRQRGLPVVVGIIFVIVSLILQSINVYAHNVILELAGVIVLHIGILAALIGLLMAEALGQ